MKSRTSVLLAVLAALSAVQGHAGVITFDERTTASTVHTGAFVSGGFQFAPTAGPGDFITWGVPNSAFGVNWSADTDGAVVLNNDVNDAVITRVGGRVFSARSFDMAETYNGFAPGPFANPRFVTFTGKRQDGSEISQTFTVGVTPGFTHMTFAPGFDNLVELVWSGNVNTMIDGQRFGGPAQIDNLALAVPEPSTWAVMILGFGLAGATIRARKAVRA